MNNVRLLDCTLRDGGYVNNWEFGEKNIIKIINNLIESKIDIIECGFLTNKKEFDVNSTKFDTVQSIKHILPNRIKKTLMVCMINYGEYKIEDIPEYDGTSVNGIRVAFHKKDLKGALEFCKGIYEKGYKLFMQPMVSVSYSDSEFIELIKLSNKLKPYAFYIVDSFGVMKKKDLMRLFYLVDHNLSNKIHIGYHSHNNIQLAYSNAQSLADLQTKRDLIIDSSVFGMGRGAGNLNTELFVEYLNEINGIVYKTKPLLKIIDQVLNRVYNSNSWGYSLPYYVSSKFNCHPNYAKYLAEKNTLAIEDISNILSFITEDKKNNLDKEYIESLYINYQSHNIIDSDSRKKLYNLLQNKSVLLIAPGKSVLLEKVKIQKEISSTKDIVISINFLPEKIKPDYVFVSNIRRFEELLKNSEISLITTSNVTASQDNTLLINYLNLLNEIEEVKDNAGLMAIKLIKSLGIKKIKLAGFDGYSYDNTNNYARENLTLFQQKETVDNLNKGMNKILKEFSEQVEIEFITKQKYLKVK